MDGEIWKDVPNAPGYQISNYGKLRSFWVKYAHGKPPKPSHIVDAVQRFPKPKTLPSGYVMYDLWGGEKVVRTYAHILVLEAFVGPRPKGYQACHNDGHRANNCVENLRWDTPKNNTADKKKHGTYKCGEQMPWAVLTEGIVRAVRQRYREGARQADLMREFDLDRRCVHALVREKIWKHVY